MTAAMKFRRLLLKRKAMTNLDSTLKSRDIILPTKVHLVKAMVFPVVMYGCESWTIKKTECWRIDAFELWYWRRLLRVPWTARRSNQSILKEISPGCSLEGMCKLCIKSQVLAALLIVCYRSGVKWSEVAQSCPTLCDPMNHRMPGLPKSTHSCPLSWWCHPTISSSVIPFCSCLQTLPESGSFQMSQLFASGGQSNGVSASTSVLPMNTQDRFL